MLDIILFCYTNLADQLCHLYIKIRYFGLYSVQFPTFPCNKSALECISDVLVITNTDGSKWKATDVVSQLFMVGVVL